MFWLDCWCRDCAVHFTIFTNLFRDFDHFWPWLHCALSLAAHCIVIGPICLCICLFICVCVCLWVCYHDNSKLRALIFTKLAGSEGSDHLQLIKFWSSCAPGKVCGGAKFFSSALLQPARNVYVSLSVLFHFLLSLFIVSQWHKPIHIDPPTQPGHPSVGRRNEYWRWLRPPLGKKTASSA